MGEIYPDPKVIVIGELGVGKSTLCNVLTGKKHDGTDENGFQVTAECYSRIS